MKYYNCIMLVVLTLVGCASTKGPENVSLQIDLEPDSDPIDSNKTIESEVSARYVFMWISSEYREDKATSSASKLLTITN